MKYLKKYESIQEHDLDFVLSKIKEEFTIDKVKEEFEKEKSEWSDDYDSDGNGEAQDIILNKLIGWFESKYNKIDIFDDVYNKLQEEYDFLKIS